MYLSTSLLHDRMLHCNKDTAGSPWIQDGFMTIMPSFFIQEQDIDLPTPSFFLARCHVFYKTLMDPRPLSHIGLYDSWTHRASLPVHRTPHLCLPCLQSPEDWEMHCWFNKALQQQAEKKGCSTQPQQQGNCEACSPDHPPVDKMEDTSSVAKSETTALELPAWWTAFEHQTTKHHDKLVSKPACDAMSMPSSMSGFAGDPLTMHIYNHICHRIAITPS